MNSELERLLTRLSETHSAAGEREIAELYRASLRFEKVGRLPVAMQYPYPPDVEFAPFAHREAVADPEKMLFNELVFAFGMSIANRPLAGDDLPATVRPNYGTVLVSSLFGARVEQVDDNPPWVRHFDSLDEFLSIFDVDAGDFTRGWLPRVVETYDLYHDVLDEFPQLKDVVKIVLPDLQGPLDNLDLLRGSDLYIDMYENPDLIHRALDLLARTQVELVRYLSQYVTDAADGFCHQHGIMNRGNVLVRNDSSIMVSPAMYREHVAPYDEAVFAGLGGGGMHSCGRFEHLVDEYLELESIAAIDFGQSDMNDVDAIYEKSSNRGVPLLRVFVDREELTSGSINRRFPTGVTLIYRADSIDDARRTMESYSAQPPNDRD